MTEDKQAKRTASLRMAGARRRAQTLAKLKYAEGLLDYGHDITFILDDVGMTPSAMAGAARRYDFPELALLAGREYQRTHPRPADYEAKRSARRRKAA